MVKYLISETHRVVTSIPNPLGVVTAKHCTTGYNHTFINFDDMFGRIGGYSWFHRATHSRFESVGGGRDKCHLRPMCHRERFRLHRQLPWVVVSGDPDGQGGDEPLRIQPVQQPYSTKETLGFAIFVAHNIRVV